MVRQVPGPGGCMITELLIAVADIRGNNTHLHDFVRHCSIIAGACLQLSVCSIIAGACLQLSVLRYVFFPGVRVQGVCCSIMDNVSAWFASNWREVVGGLLWLGLTC